MRSSASSTDLTNRTRLISRFISAVILCLPFRIGGTVADVSNAAVSQLVDRLVRQDLVERQEDPANRRTKIVRLSEKGKGLIRDSIPPNHFLRELMASLTVDQHKTVEAAFTILAQTVRRMQTFEKEKDGKHA